MNQIKSRSKNLKMGVPGVTLYFPQDIVYSLDQTLPFIYISGLKETLMNVLALTFYTAL